MPGLVKIEKELTRGGIKCRNNGKETLKVGVVDIFSIPGYVLVS